MFSRFRDTERALRERERTMLLQSCSLFSVIPSHRLLQSTESRNRGNVISEGARLFLRRKPKTSSSSSVSFFSTFVCLRIGPDAITEIAQNKVLVAAAVSVAIGQLLKPFSLAILYGNNLDFKAAFQAGGFPSSHSSAAVATAMSLGLERGFSDAIFGLAVVYAGLTMYDAQGVRREVGIHAKAFNRILLKTQSNSIPSSDADNLIVPSSRKSPSNLESLDPLFLEEPCSFRLKPSDASLSLMSESDISSNLAANGKVGSENVAHCWAPLKESVGHTVIEVISGALLGFFVSLVVCTI